MRSFQEMISLEEAVGAQAVAHRVGEARQFDAVSAHDAHPTELQALGEVEDGPAVDQRREGVIGCQGRWPRSRSAFAAQAGETLRPMMRSPASVWSR